MEKQMKINIEDFEPESFKVITDKKNIDFETRFNNKQSKAKRDAIHYRSNKRDTDFYKRNK
jgi:hypothetical protein